MAGPIIEAARARFRENRPVAAAIIEGVQNAAGNPDNRLTARDVPAVAAAVSDAMARDPRVINATNSEPPNQSRIITGTVPAVASALSTFLAGIAALFGALGPALALSGSARWVAILMTVAGGVGSSGGLFALFGRLRSNLPPMTYRIYNPFSWLAPRPPAPPS